MRLGSATMVVAVRGLCAYKGNSGLPFIGKGEGDELVGVGGR